MSLIVYIVVMAFSKDNRVTKFSRKDLYLFWKPGVGIATGWALSFLALNQEMVSIVAPILQIELLFIIFLAYVFLRKIEKVTFKLGASALLIILGVILLASTKEKPQYFCRPVEVHC